MQLRNLLKISWTVSLLVILPLLGHAQESAQVEVILVEASNGNGGVDSALRPYVSTLNRLFRFESYKQLSRRNLKLSVPGEGSTSLPGGQSLILNAKSGGGGLMAELSWVRGSKRLLHTRIQLRRGSPAVLGGPRTSGGGTQLLILTLK